MSLTMKKRVAIIGGGVSGLSAAWHIVTSSSSEEYDVTVFESEPRLGGHAWTINIPEKEIDVDVGFMVFNKENYPNMTHWFDALGVQMENSDMSFSVSIDRDMDLWNPFRIEWSSRGIKGLFATSSKLQILNPEFYRFLFDMVRFNREAASILLLHDQDPRKHVSTGQYLRDCGYSNAFAKCYLLPMMAALWSASMKDVLDFPAAQLVGFLCNHKMLQLFDRPQWKTVAGRSKAYVEAMVNLLGPERIRTSTPIVAMKKSIITDVADGDDFSAPQPIYELYSTDGASVGIFNDVIFACHTPTTASILQNSDFGINNDASSELVDLLKHVEYANNVAYLHSDIQLLPRSKNAWSSWNGIGKSSLLTTHTRCAAVAADAMEGSASGFGCHLGENPNFDHDPSKLEGILGRMKAVYVTYYLNRLQNLKTDTPILVTLNPHHPPREDLVYQKFYMAHPQFTSATLEARKKIIASFQGVNGLYFAGAWLGYGFHEDGCRSGLLAASTLTKKPVQWIPEGSDVLVSPPPDLAAITVSKNSRSILRRLQQFFGFTVPVYFCKKVVFSFMKKAIKYGRLELRLVDEGRTLTFGNGHRVKGMADDEPVVLQIFDPWFFVKVAFEYDLGFARSFMSGMFTVQPLVNTSLYDPVLRPHCQKNEATPILGDPVGLTRLFLLFIANRDYKGVSNHVPLRSSLGHTYSHALSNASGLVLAKIGSLFNFIRYKLTMDNSERGGSLKNIHAHYDISNDLFTSFLDHKTLMYSSAIYEAIKAPKSQSGLIFRGTLEEAQIRKLETLLSRGQIQPGQTILDIGFGWGGLSIYAAKKYGCKVYGITLSVEQKSLAEKRVKKAGLEHLIHFEVVDYRTFSRRAENRGRFHRVFSCEMIEAVGHEHLGDFFWAVERVLKSDGVLVMEAITTPESRYEAYLRSTDFINSIIFPGSCCPSLHALVNAAYENSTLTLDHIDNIGLHYARTLAEWRRRFNANEARVRGLGFDDVFLRTWNYYLTYCEAGFHSQTMSCLILVFARPGCEALAPLSETRSVTQSPPFSEKETLVWMTDHVSKT